MTHKNKAEATQENKVETTPCEFCNGRTRDLRTCPYCGRNLTVPEPTTEQSSSVEPTPFECENCGYKPTIQEVITHKGDCPKCRDTIITYVVDCAELIAKEREESKFEGKTAKEWAFLFGQEQWRTNPDEYEDYVKERNGLRQRAEKAEAIAKVCIDIHNALGIKWGDDPYSVIQELKKAESELKEFRKTLERCKNAIESLPSDALGINTSKDAPYYYRDELLAELRKLEGK